jgi:Protein of unknown function (DUF3617)
MHYRFACTTPRQVSGEGRVTFSGDKAYTGSSTLTAQVEGRPQQIGMQMTGQWLGADCGGLQPIGAMPAR